MRRFFRTPNEMVVSPRQDVKIYSSSPVIDKSKVGFLYCLFRWCRLARSRHNPHARPQDLANRRATLLAAEWKKRPFSLSGTTEVRSYFAFSQGRFLFRAFVTPIFCQELLGIFALLDLILFLLSGASGNFCPS